MMVLRAGFEPALDGFWDRRLYQVGLPEQVVRALGIEPSGLGV